MNSNNCQEGAWVKTIESYRHRPRSTYLNKDNPISCNGVLHSWKFCYQTGRHRTNTITVAIWSYQDREPGYIVQVGSVFTFQIESDMPNITICSNLTTGHVLVSEGDFIGVSFSNHPPLQVISIESNRTSQLLRARKVDAPRDIRESELRVVTNVALQIFPCIYTTSTTDSSSSPVSPSPTAPLTSLKVNSTSSYSVLAPPTNLEFMSTNPYTSISYFTAPNNLTELQELSTNRNSSNSKKTTASTTLLVVVVPVVLVAIGLVIFIITIILFLLHFGIRRLCPKPKVTISATNAAFESSYYNLSATRWTGDIQSSQDHEYDLPTFPIAHANPQLSCQNSEIVTVANIAYTQVSAGAKPDVTNSNSSMVYNELYGNFNPDKHRLNQ